MNQSLINAKWISSTLLILLLLVPTTQASDTPTLAQIRQAIAERGALWKAGETTISRLTAEERRRLCGAQPVVAAPEDIKLPPAYLPRAEALTGLDWRDYSGHNWTTPVRDQTSCGSCVAFGCLSAFEAAISIFFEIPEPRFDLSEQHIFSCGGGSCDGGWNVPSCLNFIQELGAPTEDCYPYLAQDDQPPNYGAPCSETCDDWQQKVQKISQWGVLPLPTEESIKSAVMISPVASYMTVYSDFYNYETGVYEHVTGGVEGGHIIAIVGWDDELDCWICKNSWGGGWGESGWFRIRKGTNEAEIESYVAWLEPMAAQYPNLELAAFAVLDSLGDDDGVLNPGETARLQVSLENGRVWAAASGVTAVLSSSDPRIDIHDLLIQFEDHIQPGQRVDNFTDEFSFTVAEGIGVCDIPLSLEISATSGKLPFYETTLDLDLSVTYDQHGWPAELSSPVSTSPLLLNMDGDDDLEVVVAGNSGRVHIWDHLGQEQAGFPVDLNGEISGSPAVGDLDGDGHLEIVVGAKNDTVYALTNTGSILFSRGLSNAVFATPVLADLDGDQSLETIVGAMDGKLYVLKDDGSDLEPFPVSLGGPILAGAAVADLDGDGSPEIAVGALNKNLYVISSSTGQALAGFPLVVGGAIVSAPSVADIDKDSYNEVLFGCDDGDLYVVDPVGGVQFRVASGQMVRTSPAVGDVDGDGSLDIVFASKSGQVYALDGSGNILPGWPFQAGGYVESSPVLVDMNGDGLLEVVFGTADEQLHLVSGDGVVLEEYPTPATGAVSSTAAVGDLDGDGDYEVLLGTPSGLSVWDYKLAAGLLRPWPMYRGNCRRTGYFGDGPATGVAAVAAGELPERYSLLPNYPNPFNAQTQIGYVLPRAGRVRLEVYNILGQRVMGLVDGAREVGSHVVAWDGRDQFGEPVASGVYFCRMRVGDYRETRRMVLLR